MNVWPLALAAGGGAIAYFAFGRSALATEDDSGEEVPPTEAKPLFVPVTPSAPPSPSKAQAPSTPSTLSRPSSSTGLGLKAVEVLTRMVGAKEDPPRSNRGPVVDQINIGIYEDGKKLLGQPWCARTVRYGFEKAAQELGLPPPFASIKGTLAGVSDWKDKFSKYRLDAPKPGAVALIDNDKVRHATLVSNASGDTVYTVEGNHKDSLATVKRKKSAFDGGFYDVEAFVRDAQMTNVSGTIPYLDAVGLVGRGEI